MQKKHFKLGVIIIILAWTVFPGASGAASAGEAPDFNVLVGQWVRPDGGYILHVRDVHADLSVDAGYFNPRKINVAEADVSLWKGFVKLFVKLQDRGYPGSTYTLYYYAEKDALAGFYYQALMKQTYEVAFLRKKAE